MKLGAVFSRTDIGDDPVAIKDFVQAIEDLGYDYLSAYEHANGTDPNCSSPWKVSQDDPNTWHMPFVLIGHLAGLTQKLKFLTSVLVPPPRQTVQVAKQAAKVDVLSSGRLRLGVTVAWNPFEHPGMKVDRYDGGKRIEEQITVLRELWTKPSVTFKGDYYTIDQVGIDPLPVQRPIPIWISGTSDTALWHVARLGDGWFAPTLPIPQAKEMVTKLRGYLAQAGREPGDLSIRCRVWLSMASVWPEYVQLWRELGATHVELCTMGGNLKTPQEHIETLRRFKEKVNE